MITRWKEGRGSYLWRTGQALICVYRKHPFFVPLAAVALGWRDMSFFWR